MDNPALIGTTEPQWLLASDAVDLLLKGHVDRALPEDQRPLSDQQLAWADKLQAEDALALRFNTDLPHRRRFARAGAGRHLGRGRRFVLHADR